MVQSINDLNVPSDINSVGGSQPNSTKVTENKVSQFENSVKKLQENFLNDAKLLKASRTVRSFGDIFTANMAGKDFGRIAQFFTNIGLYFQTPKKLLRNTEKNIDALQQLLQQKANSSEKITSSTIKTVADCIQKADEAIQMIQSDETIPENIRQDFQNLYKKDLFKIRQHDFLGTVAEGIDLSEKLTDLKTEADFDAIKELADKIDTCDFIRKEHPAACRKSLFTLLSNQFSHVTNNFLNNAKEFITSFNNDIDAALKKNEELNGEKTLSDEKCKELIKKFLEFTGKIRSFHDALMLSKVENGEPECLQKFRSDYEKKLVEFKALPEKVKKHAMSLENKYKDLRSFPYFVDRDAEKIWQERAKAQKA